MPMPKTRAAGARGGPNKSADARTPRRRREPAIPYHY